MSVIRCRHCSVMTLRLWSEKLKSKVFNTAEIHVFARLHVRLTFWYISQKVFYEIQAFMSSVIFSSFLNLPGKKNKIIMKNYFNEVIRARVLL